MEPTCPLGPTGLWPHPLAGHPRSCTQLCLVTDPHTPTVQGHFSESRALQRDSRQALPTSRPSTNPRSWLHPPTKWQLPQSLQTMTPPLSGPAVALGPSWVWQLVTPWPGLCQQVACSLHTRQILATNQTGSQPSLPDYP